MFFDGITIYFTFMIFWVKNDLFVTTFFARRGLELSREYANSLELILEVSTGLTLSPFRCPCKSVQYNNLSVWGGLQNCSIAFIEENRLIFWDILHVNSISNLILVTSVKIVPCKILRSILFTFIPSTKTFISDKIELCIDQIVFFSLKTFWISSPSLKYQFF